MADHIELHRNTFEKRGHYAQNQSTRRTGTVQVKKGQGGLILLDRYHCLPTRWDTNTAGMCHRLTSAEPTALNCLLIAMEAISRRITMQKIAVVHAIHPIQVSY